MAPQVQSGENVLKRVTKKIESATLLLAMTLVLMRGFDEVTRRTSPSWRSELVASALLAVLSSSLAVALFVLGKRLIPSSRRTRRVLGPGNEETRDTLSRHLTSTSACLLVSALMLYFVGSRTDFWRTTYSWWSGPLIDLTSRMPEQSFQPIVSLPWLNYGQDFGQVSPWSWNGVSKNRSALETTFSRLRKQGVRCVVWFLFCDGRSLEFDANRRVSGISSKFIEDYDTALEIAREYGVGILWVVIDYQLMFPGKSVNGASIFGNADIIEQSDKRQSFLDNALKPILKRYPYESRIAGWILINEPEHAIKEGYVSSGAIRGFTHEAAMLIRQNTDRQPVSVANADLESLIEYSGANAGDVDFFIFHHYEHFLPPPVSNVRDLMAEGNDKPIYWGEFDIQNPPVSIPHLITWTQALGYAGIWPWSANHDANRYPKGDPSSLDENLAVIFKTSAATRARIEVLRRAFLERRDHGSVALIPRFDQELDWWNKHWSSVTMPRIGESVRRWASNTVSEETQYERNRDWEDDKTQRRASLGRLKTETQIKLSNANQNLIETERLPVKRDVKRDIKLVEDLKVELRRIETEIRNQESDIQVAKERMALHRALGDYYRYKAKWANALYEKFWESEKNSDQR